MKPDSKKNFYILVVSNADGNSGKRISSHDILRHRLNKKSWPLFKGTSKRNKIKPDDKVVFYLAGPRKGSQSFAATAEIEEIFEWNYGSETIDMEDALTPNPSNVLKLKNINVFSEPISIRPKIKKLNFIKKPEIWQIYMQSGCISLTEKDFKFALTEGDI